jgi:membrane fusion protein (multidrug efflux system)
MKKSCGHLLNTYNSKPTLSTTKKMKKIIQTLLVTVPLLFCSCSSKDEAVPPPPDVTVYQTQAQDIPIYREYVGQLFGFKDIAIQARVEGFLEGIHFDEGSRIKEGMLLYTLESQPFEANVSAMMSGVAEAQTMLAKTKSDLARIRPLAEQKAVSESELDSAVARHDASIASLEAARANLRVAKIQLSYTTIHSPIDGIIGKTKAKVGDFVGRSPAVTVLNTVSQINTVLVQAFITEDEYLEFTRYSLAKQEALNQEPEEKDLDLQLILSDGSVYEHKGTFDFINREVDPTAGSMLIQASFPNPEKMLRPGQFAKLKVRITVMKDGILIPQRCVMELQGLHSVYTVDASNKVQKQDIKTGPKIGQFWLVTEGLQPGESVIYEGLQKVQADVTVNPIVQEIK